MTNDPFREVRIKLLRPGPHSPGATRGIMHPFMQATQCGFRPFPCVYTEAYLTVPPRGSGVTVGTGRVKHDRGQGTPTTQVQVEHECFLVVLVMKVTLVLLLFCDWLSYTRVLPTTQHASHLSPRLEASCSISATTAATSRVLMGIR